MAVTNLTATKWLLNASITTMASSSELIDGDAGNLDEFNLSFLSNSNSYSLLRIQDGDVGRSWEWGIYYNTTHVFGPQAWADEAYRTIEITAGTDVTNTTLIAWLQANGTLTLPAQAGYEVTFVTNGGTSVTKLEDVEELPTPLPTTNKANNVFVGWFYDSEFEIQAFSGDTISSNVTLYAKWYANMEDFYEDVADEIRIKNGETNPIKHTDFAYKIKNIQGAKPEETKTVTPDFVSGNVVVTPTSGKVLSEVTVVKDNDLVPENIVKDVNIFGVVGTAETGGGVDPDALITVHALFTFKPSGSTPGKITWNIPSALLDKLYCYKYSGGKHYFYKLSDVYLVGNSAGGTVYASKLNTETGSLTRNVSTNGNNIGFCPINYPVGNVSPGGIGLLCIMPPDESVSQYSYVTFKANNGAIVDMGVKKCEIPKSLLEQYYPGFNESMIKRFDIYDGAIRLANNDGW